uniref:Uncharacterized protein n=1 Tax=Parascaris univalens TaxID=6257 RepID=A0A915BAF7_PARUN
MNGNYSNNLFACDISFKNLKYLMKITLRIIQPNVCIESWKVFHRLSKKLLKPKIESVHAFDSNVSSIPLIYSRLKFDFIYYTCRKRRFHKVIGSCID